MHMIFGENRSFSTTLFIIATFSSQDEGDSTSQVKYTSSHNHGSQNLDPSNSTVVTFQISRHFPLKTP